MPIQFNVRSLLPAAIIVGLLVYWFGGLPRLNLLNVIRDDKVSMKDLLSVSVELAKKGGMRVTQIRSENDMAEQVKGKTQEGAKEMLTKGDMESHRAMVYGLNKIYPHLTVISEEHESNQVDYSEIPMPSTHNPDVSAGVKDDEEVSASDITIWVDPLDATQEYTEKLDQYVTTMVCVAVRGEPVIGVVHKPFTGVTVWGWVGHGHSRNIEAKMYRDEGIRALNKFIVSRSHTGEVRGVLQNSFGTNTEIVEAGGAGYKTLEVLAGNVNAYVHVTYIKKWDLCAANALLRTMNGHMTTLDGATLDYSTNTNILNKNGLLASVMSPRDHQTYLERLRPEVEKLRASQMKK